MPKPKRDDLLAQMRVLSGRPRTLCGVARAFARLDADTVAVFEEALLDRGLSAPAIAKVLSNQSGESLGRQVVSRHRTGQCACAQPEDH